MVHAFSDSKCFRKEKKKMRKKMKMKGNGTMIR